MIGKSREFCKGISRPGKSREKCIVLYTDGKQFGKNSTLYHVETNVIGTDRY